MNKAEDIANLMLESPMDEPEHEELSAEELFARWEKVNGTYKHLQGLRKQQDAVMDELRYGIEIRRALARHGKRTRDVAHYIPGEQLQYNRYEKAKKHFTQNGYRLVVYGAPKGGKLIMSRDIVGAELKDGSTVLFDEPIAPFQPRPPMPVEPTYPDETPTPKPGEV